MDTQRKHQELVKDHCSLNSMGKKRSLSGMLMMVSIFTVLYSCKQMNISHYTSVAYALFSLAVYLFIKDFLYFRKLEAYSVQIISKGITIESRNSSIQNFFHQVLEDFKLKKILFLNSSINMVAFVGFGYFMKLLVLETSIATTHWILIGLCAAVFTTLAHHWQLFSLTPLEELRETTLKTAIS